MQLSCFTGVCPRHGGKLWRPIVQTVCVMAAHSGCPLCSQGCPGIYTLPSPPLMRAVIIPCTGPDNPANEDNRKMKNPNTRLMLPSGGFRVAVLITELDNMLRRLSLPGFELHLILHSW